MKTLLESFIQIVIEEKLQQEAKINPKDLEKYPTFDQKIKYMDKFGLNRKKIGKGSSRVAYVLDSKRVLKLAFNHAGYAQNRAEIETNKMLGSSGLTTKIYEYGSDYSWLVSEIVREVRSPEEFESITGISFYLLSEALYNFNTTKNIASAIESKRKQTLGLKQRQPNRAIFFDNSLKKLDELENSSLLKNLMELIQQAKLQINDLLVLEHWGKTADGRVVLLDYGFTEQVEKDFYSRVG